MVMPTVAAALLHPSAVAAPSSSAHRAGLVLGSANASVGNYPAGARGWRRRQRPRPRAAAGRAPAVEIPLTCYQILGVTEKAEKDEIVKSAIEQKKSDIGDGYSEEVSICRQALLVDVRDKLLFEQEYAGSKRAKVPPRSSLHIPWSWFPVTLCALQEVMCNVDTLQSKDSYVPIKDSYLDWPV